MFSLKNEEKKTKYCIIGIIACFFIFSLIIVLNWGNSTLLGSLETFDNDDVKYIRSAWTLVDTGVLTYEDITTPTAFIMPGLTYVLAGFTWAFGKMNGIVAFRVFQVILQCGSLYLLFLISRKIFNSKAAIIACLIDSLYFVETYAASLVLMECLFKFLFLLLIYISIYALTEKKVKFYISAGFVWALSCLFRPPIAIYPLVILIFWVRNKYKVKDIIKYTSIVLVIFCAVMSPWWIRNYKEFDTFIPFTKSTGNPFLQGTFPNYDKSGGFGVPYEEGDNYIDNDAKQVKMGLERLKIYVPKEPLKYLWWYTGGKTIELWESPFYWNGRTGLIISGVWHYMILITGVLGIVKGFRRGNRNKMAGFILSIIIVLNISYLPYFTFSRYAYPLMALVIIFSANFFYGISKRWGRNNEKRIYNTDCR